MKTSIISLLPSRQSAGPTHNWSSSLALARQRQPFVQDIEKPAPDLRILRSLADNENLFNYACRANNARWETFVFAALALSALTALFIAIGALVG